VPFRKERPLLLNKTIAGQGRLDMEATMGARGQWLF
jgi:hypothetical protein